MVLSSGAVATVLAAVTFFALPGSPPEVVDDFSDPLEVATGVGWAVHPDSTAGAGVTFVEGPATPPLGRGSLELYTPEMSDRALAFAVPTGAPGEEPLATPWTGLSASYATFIPDGVLANSTPTLRFVGYHDLRTGLDGFTTLTFQPQYDGTVENGVWQTWDLGPDSIMFQSNDDEGFCNDPGLCTLSQFAAKYPFGGFYQVQVGLGSGVPAGSLGYADAVVVRSGDTAEYSYDFELPASENSTASVVAGAATATGGSATVTLNATAISATPTVPFTIVVTLPDGTEQTEVVEVDADSTDELSIPVPFGTTHVEVWAQDTLLAEGDVTFTAPVTPPVTPPVTGGGGELAPTGFDPVPAYWGAALLAAGLAMVAAGRVRARARGTDRRPDRRDS